MPHLWMFRAEGSNSRGHEVLLIDGNAQPWMKWHRRLAEEKIDSWASRDDPKTRKAYRMADAIRAVGGPCDGARPHVTEMADEALVEPVVRAMPTRDSSRRSDDTWPKHVEEAAKGTSRISTLRRRVRPGQKHSLQSSAIPWAPSTSPSST